MGAEVTNEIARLILGARESGRRVGIPAAEPAIDVANAVQDAVVGSFGGIGGWKVGASSPDSEPLCSPLPSSLIFASGLRTAADRFTALGLEAEIAFRIGRDLPPRDSAYEREEVEDAIAAALPAIEVVDSRWRGWPDIPPIWHMADLLSNGALVCGPERGDWRTLDLVRQPVRLDVNGRTIVERVGGNKGGDMLRLVTWLANHAARRSGGLKAGDVVTTGSCTGLEFAAPGAHVAAEFGDLGRVEVEFPVSSDI